MSNFVDISGNRYRFITAIATTRIRHNGHVIWFCACDCGNIKFASENDLVKGRIVTCGPGCPFSHCPESLYGHKTGRLEVVKPTPKKIKGRTYWYCRCQCGKEKWILGIRLKNGDTKSCGCLRIEVSNKRMQCMQKRRQLRKDIT